MGDVEMLIHDHVSQSIVPKSSTRLGQLQACNEEGMPSGPLACRPKKMVLSIGRMLELELTTCSSALDAAGTLLDQLLPSIHQFGTLMMMPSLRSTNPTHY